jgi:SAM-dependent methyltransferase
VSGEEITHDHVAELVRLGLDYWWYAVRRGHVDAALDRLPRGKELAYLDFGCGPGILTEHVIQRLRPRHALGVDGTQAAIRGAARIGVPVEYRDFRDPLALPFEPDAITALDVLEHLADPVLALRHLAAAAARDATLIATVPAMPSLHSRWDDLSGHQRRYTRSLLVQHLVEGGWTPLRVRYFFSYCVPLAWIERKLLRRVREFEFPTVSRAANWALTMMGHAERHLGCPLPFGTSLLVRARRT